MQLSNLGISALFVAADLNFLPVAQLLVRHGANPSASHLIRALPALCCRAYIDAHPHLECEPLFATVQNDNFAMVKLILTASPRMPYAALRNLRDIVFRTDYAREASLSQRALTQYAHFFVGILSRPRSLRDECRGTIREALRNRPATKVGRLPLPDRLKDYILLRGDPIVGEQ